MKRIISTFFFILVLCFFITKSSLVLASESDFFFPSEKLVSGQHSYIDFSNIPLFPFGRGTLIFKNVSGCPYFDTSNHVHFHSFQCFNFDSLADDEYKFINTGTFSSSPIVAIIESILYNDQDESCNITFKAVVDLSHIKFRCFLQRKYISDNIQNIPTYLVVDDDSTFLLEPTAPPNDAFSVNSLFSLDLGQIEINYPYFIPDRASVTPLDPSFTANPLYLDVPVISLMLSCSTLPPYASFKLSFQLHITKQDGSVVIWDEQIQPIFTYLFSIRDEAQTVQEIFDSFDVHDVDILWDAGPTIFTGPEPQANFSFEILFSPTMVVFQDLSQLHLLQSATSAQIHVFIDSWHDSVSVDLPSVTGRQIRDLATHFQNPSLSFIDNAYVFTFSGIIQLNRLGFCLLQGRNDEIDFMTSLNTLQVSSSLSYHNLQNTVQKQIDLIEPVFLSDGCLKFDNSDFDQISDLYFVDFTVSVRPPIDSGTYINPTHFRAMYYNQQHSLNLIPFPEFRPISSGSGIDLNLEKNILSFKAIFVASRDSSTLFAAGTKMETDFFFQFRPPTGLGEFFDVSSPVPICSIQQNDPQYVLRITPWTDVPESFDVHSYGAYLRILGTALVGVEYTLECKQPLLSSIKLTDQSWFNSEWDLYYWPHRLWNTNRKKISFSLPYYPYPTSAFLSHDSYLLKVQGARISNEFQFRQMIDALVLFVRQDLKDGNDRPVFPQFPKESIFFVTPDMASSKQFIHSVSSSSTPYKVFVPGEDKLEKGFATFRNGSEFTFFLDFQLTILILFRIVEAYRITSADGFTYELTLTVFNPNDNSGQNRLIISQPDSRAAPTLSFNDEQNYYNYSIMPVPLAFGCFSSRQCSTTSSNFSFETSNTIELITSDTIGCFSKVCSTFAQPKNVITIETILNGLSYANKPFNRLPTNIVIHFDRLVTTPVEIYGTNEYTWGYSRTDRPIVQSGKGFADISAMLNPPSFNQDKNAPHHDFAPPGKYTVQLISFPTQTNGQIISSNSFIIQATFELEMTSGDIQMRKFLNLNTFPPFSASFVIFRLTSTSSLTVDSTPFTMVSSCKSFTNQALGFDNIKAWTDNCSGHGICQSNGVCLCREGYTGSTCATPPVPSNSCQSSSTFCGTHGSCNNVTQQCDCTSGWKGDKCQTKIECTLHGNDFCSNHGHFETDPLSDECSSGRCECDGGWISSKCEDCGMQCKNSGRALKSCDGPCGCAAGFSGTLCDCSQRRGSLVLAMDNELVSFANQARQKFALANGIVAGQIWAIDIAQITELSKEIIDAYNTIVDTITYNLMDQLGLLSQTSAKIQTAFETLEMPIPDSSSSENPSFYIATRFILTITYNCKASEFIDLGSQWKNHLIPSLPTDTINQFFTATLDDTSPTNIDDPSATPSTIDDSHFSDKEDDFNHAIIAAFSLYILSCLLLIIFFG